MASEGNPSPTVFLFLQRWPPCNEELLRNFKWDAVQAAAQHEPESDLSLSARPHNHVELRPSPDLVASQASGSQTSGPALSAGSQLPSSQGHSSFVGLPAAGAHLY